MQPSGNRGGNCATSAPGTGAHLEADRFFPSSKTCHACEHVQDIGWSEYWSCEARKAQHQRDDNAAINLAKAANLGAVGAPVKRGAEHKTGPRPAAGQVPRKGGPASAEPNNSVRSAA
jgi:putative transposase